MLKKYKVGIVGNGFVGKAISHAFSNISEVYIYDKNPSLSKNTVEQINNCNFVFVCVPTPMFKDGTQDLSYVNNVFENTSGEPIYIIKSTVLPGTTNRIEQKYPNLKIVFSPEFLREKTANLDMINPSRIILGGKKLLIQEVKELFEQRFKNVEIVLTDSKTAELIKYMNNVFLATKVSVMNEFKLLCDKIGANWNKSLYGFSLDHRIGSSHLNVPGHDGKLGYGGTCFPKDVNAFIEFAKSQSIHMNAIEGGWKTNLDLRPEKDWEKKIGRAVSIKKNFKN